MREVSLVESGVEVLHRLVPRGAEEADATAECGCYLEVMKNLHNLVDVYGSHVNAVGLWDSAPSFKPSSFNQST